MWSWPSAGGGMVAKVSSSGPSRRSGWVSSAPVPALPRQAASTSTKARPRSGSGSCGAGGSRTRRPWEETSSGTVSVHARQACSTSAARWIGKNRFPAYRSRTGYNRISSAVTTPMPPPPRTAQNRSGSWPAPARTRSPSGVTSSAAVTLPRPARWPSPSRAAPGQTPSSSRYPDPADLEVPRPPRSPENTRSDSESPSGPGRHFGLAGAAGRGREQAQVAGQGNGVGPVVGAELGVQGTHVELDGVGRDVQLAGDFRPGQVGGQVAQHPQLAVAQRLQRLRRPGRRRGGPVPGEQAEDACLAAPAESGQQA